MLPAATGGGGYEAWRFTWETQSHASVIRLLVFNSDRNLRVEFRDLEVNTLIGESLVVVSFKENGSDEATQLRVPIPRVLIDHDSLPQVKAFDDHIEVKLVLLLPVAHPLISEFDSILNLEEERNGPCRPVVNSDLKKLSEMEEVNFYCRNCSYKLTKGLSDFHEMPSVNWREVADNWFGNCCCSFGGVSEKLVATYAKSYMCAPGSVLLSESSALVCKNDLLGCELRDIKISKQSVPQDGVQEPPGFTRNVDEETKIKKDDSDCCNGSFCSPELVESLSKVRISSAEEEVGNERVFLDGYLGSGFMIRSSGISKDIKWNEYLCPQCSHLIGAYPYIDEYTPIDGGVRLFKCNISTCLPRGELKDIFRNYNLERMLATQLLEIAQDELSYRTVVRDIQTKSMLMHIVLLNPNSWGCSGNCNLDVSADFKQVMHPMIKVLYSAPGHGMEFDSRTLEDLIRKDKADEIYMFSSQICKLVRVLKQGNDQYPLSCAVLQDLFLSSMSK